MRINGFALNFLVVTDWFYCLTYTVDLVTVKENRSINNSCDIWIIFIIYVERRLTSRRKARWNFSQMIQYWQNR